MYLGGGRDRVWLRAGNDYAIILAADGRRDTIRCGRGDDGVFLQQKRDPRDRFLGCETVRRGLP